MKKLTLSLLIIFPLLAPAQEPMWTSSTFRDLNYPASTWFTGFSRNYLQAGTDVNTALRTLERDAQNQLTESIVISITSESRLENFSSQQQANGQFSEFISTDYQQVVRTASSITAVGMNVRSFHNTATGAVYAFAVVNRFELIGFQRSNLTINLRQAENHLQTARNLEENRETSNARQQIELAKPLLNSIREVQHLLIAIDTNASSENLQLQKTENLYSKIVQMQARLAQAVLVYVESNEILFDTYTNLIANRVKADLATRGNSFVDDMEQAHFVLTINANARFSSQNYNIAFSFADVEVRLFDNHRNRIVFADEFSERAGANTKINAGRRAMENSANRISQKLNNWLE